MTARDKLDRDNLEHAREVYRTFHDHTLIPPSEELAKLYRLAVKKYGEDLLATRRDD